MTYFSHYSQEWNKLNDDIKSSPPPISLKKQNSVLLRSLKISFLQFMTIAALNYSICRANQWTGFYLIGTSVMEELRINFSHLNEHKFRHNFPNTINTMCSCDPGP